VGIKPWQNPIVGIGDEVKMLPGIDGGFQAARAIRRSGRDVPTWTITALRQYAIDF
jgi:hypothetical protein